MREYKVRLSISADQMLAYYQGVAEQVIARDEQGVRVSFPAQALRPFVTHEGVHGCFCIRVDANNRLLGLRKLP